MLNKVQTIRPQQCSKDDIKAFVNILKIFMDFLKKSSPENDCLKQLIGATNVDWIQLYLLNDRFSYIQNDKMCLKEESDTSFFLILLGVRLGTS